jgi:threonine synthase
VEVNENISSLELFHGPTLAFKDVGARFMSRCLGYFLKDHDKKVTVLVATSGDTGGAVANGFYEVEGVEVVILYPSGKVSPVQEKQLTTLGKNIHALEVKGTFDDCQQMVKQAFVDEELNQKLFLTSANSINVARWLPQQFYYFFAYKQWQLKEQSPVMSVPVEILEIFAQAY